MDPGTLIGSAQFGAGLAAGVLATGATLGWRAVADRRQRAGIPPSEAGEPRPAGGVGIAIVAAVVGAAAWLGPRRAGADLGPAVVAGLALLWLSGAVLRREPRPRSVVVATLGAFPGAALLAVGTTDAPAWALALLVLGTVVAGTTTADVDRRYGPTGVPALAFLLALGGMYATLPDTELARIALGAALPVTLLAWPFGIARLGPGGSVAVTGLFLWIAVTDGSGRWGSAVGAAACLGVLLAEPVGRALAAGRRAPAARELPPVVLLGIQVLLVAWGARVAGLQHAPAPAAVLAGCGLGAAGIVVHAVARRTRRRRAA